MKHLCRKAASIPGPNELRLGTFFSLVCLLQINLELGDDLEQLLLQSNNITVIPK